MIMYRKSFFLSSLLVVLFWSCTLCADEDDSLTEQSSVYTSDIVLPAPSELPSIPKLPDPFKFMDGKRMTSLDDWTSRRSEISLLVQEYVYGPKPDRPSSVTGSYSDEQLTVNCSENGKSISFTARIAYPPTGMAPYPAIITIGPWLTLPKTELDNLGIAVIYFPNDEIGNQTSAGSRGKGKFYDLYGSDHQAGSLMAWAWGISRLIDVLEQTPEANINPARLGVTGCSRNGKGALVCGAFDERIALTIPTESGAGGASSWRVADAMVAAGRNVQTARQIVTENTWMAPIFAQFGNQVDKLPVDQHMVAALCAPRPLFITENTAFEWLGPEACYTTAVAAHKVWEALGIPDRMGFVQTSHGDHCGFKEIEELRAFCTKFLLDGQADTNVLKTDGNFVINPSDWIDWHVPLLEGVEAPLVYEVENTGIDCPEPPLPSFDELPNIESLPDPFMWSDSGRGRITSRDEWRCRRAEIAAELQHYELGTKPAPPSNLEAGFSDGLLTVTIEKGRSSLTLTAPVNLPAGTGPFPAVIGVGFTGAGSLPPDIFTNRGIATIQYNFGEIAPVFPGRGEGAFYDLYPDPNVGSFIGWAWGISRIIDGLEKTPEANIDIKHLAVTGCSFAGKIALFAGAFDERIALTIPQESGGGGDAAWRVSETLSGHRETLSNAQGVAWYYQDLRQFNNAVTKLPYDHHELMAMVAPRALFVLGNPDMEYLATESGYVACKAAYEVWNALGVPERFGFSQVGGHGHCQLPDIQRPEVEAFVEKFLLGDENANTDISTSPYNTDLSRWITWDTPELK
jgi:hypothetical protein